MAISTLHKRIPLAKLESDELTDEIVFPNDLSSFGHYIAFRVFERSQGTIAAGLRGQNYLDNPAEVIFLPMPANLATAYNVTYQNEDLGYIGAQVVSVSDKTINKINEVTNKVSATWKSKQTALSKAAETATHIGSGILDSAISTYDAITQSGAITTAVSAVLAGAGPATVKSAFADAANIAANPHRVVLLQGPEFREHQFSYRLSPKSVTESQSIEEIIYTFKRRMHPEFGTFQNNAGTGINSRAFFKYPDIFVMEFRNRENLFEYAPAVLKNFSVQYHPQGYPAYIRSGASIAPAEVQLDMTFQEIDIITREFIDAEWQRKSSSFNSVG